MASACCGRWRGDPPEEGLLTTACYKLMIVFSLVANLYVFFIGGYATDFVRDWWSARIAAARSSSRRPKTTFTPEAEATHRLANVAGKSKRLTLTEASALRGSKM